MKVLVVTGASGGHIFPAVSFINTLKERRSETEALLLLPRRGLKPQILSLDCKIEYISTSTITFRISAANLMAIARFLKGIRESLSIILKFKPDIVVGFGSIDSVPALFIAWLFRIKTLIHEQNVYPGRANRFLAHFSDRIAVSFNKTKDFLKVNPDKVVLTGNPLRRELKRIDKYTALAGFGLARDKFTILVMGGSQGSRRINAEFLKAAALLPKELSYQVIHLTGPFDFDSTAQAYKNTAIQVKVFDFFNTMEQAYSASDLVISRAGATTIAELSYFGLPAILIPYPFAYAHQYNNARILEEPGRAVIIKDEELETLRFNEVLGGLIASPEKIKAMRASYIQAPEGCAVLCLTELAVSLV